MDLNAYSLQKLNKEKRERQPNWTEPEKQLLLSLTRIHQSILENKGSDTMTIKRKSAAWDEIALRMKAAGFNRSKERLKQQLGRIRAAEAKRIKDGMEKNVSMEHIEILNEENIKFQKPHFNNNPMELASNNLKSFPINLPIQERQYIKSEEAISINQKKFSEQELQINSSTNVKPNKINYTIINSCNENAENSKILSEMDFKLQNVQSLAASNHNVEVDGSDNEANRTCTADVSSTIPYPTVSIITKTSSTKQFESNQISNSGNDENADCSFSESKCQKQQQSNRYLHNVRSNRVRCLVTREQSLRQLYMYRAAVERERLRNLRLQRRRDRVLYRKDIEIQNLKLQILRNLTNQNRDANSINL